MAVQTTEEFKNGGATSYAITIEYLKASDIYVRIDGASQTYVASSPSAGEYTVSGTTVTLGATAAAGTGNVHIYRETDVNTPAAVFAVGSAIKASELNAIHDMGRFAAVEHRNKIITADIKEGQVTSTEIKDGSILNADINASAAIDNTKIADGLLKSGITVNSANIVDGSIVNTDVSNSAAISGSKLADDSIAMTKLLGGALPGDITVSTTNIEANTIVDSDINASAAISHSKLNLDIVNSDINSGANIAGSKLANDSVDLTKLGGGALPTDITVAASNIVDGTIGNIEINNAAAIEFSKLETGALPSAITVDNSNIITGTLDNRYYTETELDAGQLDNQYYTETELDAGQLDTRYYTEAELNGGQLNTLYFTESEITGGAADGRYYTETELDAGQLDNRYFTETELTGGALDGRYYTETEAEAKFLRQDSSETIASGVSWSNSDAHVATTAAINARIIDLVDDVGGFTVIADELNFPDTNPQGSTGQAAILSIGSLTAGYTRTGTTVTIANGTVAPGNRTVTIKNVPIDLPSGFGLLVESTATLDEYTFHRLVPIATQVNTVAQNIINIAAAGANVVDINNFADLYQIAANAPTQRVDGNSLVSGDLWFDNSNGNLRVWDGSTWAIITPAQSVLNDIAIVSGAITYAEDLGLITDAVTTGSSNGSLDIVADALEDEATFTVTVSGGAFLIDGVSKPALTLYKGWTYTFDNSDSSNATHPLRFYAGSSQYSTNVVVTGTQGSAGAKVSIKIPETQPTNFQYYCTAHSGMGNTITVKDDPIKTVSDNVVKLIAVADNSANINTVAANNTNITDVATNATNINAVRNNQTNIDAVNANKTNIDAVAGNNPNITAVATNATNINAVNANKTNIDAVATNESNITAVKNNESNITAVANNATNINAVNANKTNIDAVKSNETNINSAVSNATNINTVATNITDVNTFADRYQIATSNPSTDGGGNALSPGDLFFNSSANELRIWNGTQWQGGVTATGDLSQVSGSTFTGDNKYNDNIKLKLGTDSDLLLFHDTNDSIINEAGTGNLKIQNAGSTKLEVKPSGVDIAGNLVLTSGSLTMSSSISTTGAITATTINDPTNLTLDFGTL